MSNLRYTLLIYDEDDSSVQHFFENNFDVRFERVREVNHFDDFGMLRDFVSQTELYSDVNSFSLNLDMADEKLPEGSLVIPVRPVPFRGHRPPSEVPTVDLEQEQEREVLTFSTKQLDKEKKPQLIEDGTSDDFIDVLNGSPEQVHTYDAEINGNVQQLFKNRKESVILNEKLVIKLSNDFEEVVQRTPSEVPTTSLEDEEEQEKIRLIKLKMLAKEVNFPLVESTEMTNINLDNDPREENFQSPGIEHQNVDFQNPGHADISANEGLPITALHERAQIAPLDDVHSMEDEQEKTIVPERHNVAKSATGNTMEARKPLVNKKKKKVFKWSREVIARIQRGLSRVRGTSELGETRSISKKLAQVKKQSKLMDEMENREEEEGLESDRKHKRMNYYHTKAETMENASGRDFYQIKREKLKMIAESCLNNPATEGDEIGFGKWEDKGKSKKGKKSEENEELEVDEKDELEINKPLKKMARRRGRPRKNGSEKNETEDDKKKVSKYYKHAARKRERKKMLEEKCRNGMATEKEMNELENLERKRLLKNEKNRENKKRRMLKRKKMMRSDKDVSDDNDDASESEEVVRMAEKSGFNRTLHQTRRYTPYPG